MDSGADKMRRAEDHQVNPTIMALRAAEAQVTELSALVVKQSDELRRMNGMLKRTADRSRRRGIALKEINRAYQLQQRWLEWEARAGRSARDERDRWHEATKLLGIHTPAVLTEAITRMRRRLEIFENGP